MFLIVNAGLAQKAHFAVTDRYTTLRRIRTGLVLLLAVFAPLPGAAAGAADERNDSRQAVRQPAATAGADANAAMCTQHQGSPVTDAMIQSLPAKQREAVTAALRGVFTGLARDSGTRGALQRVTLHVDGARNAVICVPLPRAPSPGTTPATAYVVHRIEPSGRMETLQPGAPPLVYNDANEPHTVAARCAGLITACVRASRSNTLDACFAQQPACPAGRLDPAASCCPQACKDAYRRERARGTEAETATIRVIFGDDAGAASCIPGMPARG